MMLVDAHALIGEPLVRRPLADIAFVEISTTDPASRRFTEPIAAFGAAHAHEITCSSSPGFG